MYGSKYRSLHRKNQAPGDAWLLLKSISTVQLVMIVFAKQLYHCGYTFARGTCGRRVTMYIFRPWKTLKDGTKIYAKSYGKRAFRFWIGPGPEPVKK